MTDTITPDAKTAPVYATRREAREAERQQQQQRLQALAENGERARVTKVVASSKKSAEAPVAGRRVSPKTKGASARRIAAGAGAFAVAAGFMATVIAPTLQTQQSASAQEKDASLAELSLANAQTLTVSRAADVQVERDDFKAPTAGEMKAQDEAKLAEQRRQALATQQGTASATSSTSTTRTAALAAADGSIVGIAQAMIGVPYVWGGSTPGGFDCSGFVMWVYGQRGVSLPHSVSGIMNRGVQVSRAEAQPGDVVSWGVEHDGIYIGNGMVLHAPYEGVSVRIEPVWGNPTFTRIG